MRRGVLHAAWAALALAAALGGLTGCAKVDGTMVPNRPPEPTLWVTGELDTVAHTQHFYRDGHDPAGTVIGFECKGVYKPGAAPADYDSSLWTFTEERDSLFSVWTPNGVDFPAFAVRAIDDEYLADPTPARQEYWFSNEAPVVQLTGTPPDTTLPVATFRWTAIDPDGDGSKATFRIWLDGAPDRDTVLAGPGVTLPAYFFEEPGGGIAARRRTAYITAVDVGGRASEPVTFTWFVRPQLARSPSTFLQFFQPAPDAPAISRQDRVEYRPASLSDSSFGLHTPGTAASP